MAQEDRPRERPSGTAILWALLACIAVGGLLLGMTGFILTASLTLLLVTSPFLFISSPLLLTAGVVLAASMAGFGAAAAMACVGVSAFKWAACTLRGRGEAPVGGAGRLVDTLPEAGRKVKEQVLDMGEWVTTCRRRC